MNEQLHHQPTNQEPTDHDHGRDQAATDHATTSTWVTMEQAAEMLGITVNAVRQRIKRETLAAVKTDEGWLVDMSETNRQPTTQRPPTTAADQPATNHATISTNQQPTIDLEPLTEVIRDQNRRLEELSAAAAFWQFRAQQAEEQLKQLSAGGSYQHEATEGPESAGEDANTKTYRATTQMTSEGILARLRRWIAGDH